MIRKHVLTAVFVVVGAMLLAGIAAQLPSSHAMAQAAQPAAALAPAVDVGGTFTYQGLLQQNGAAFDGSCDVEFSLFDALTVGTQVGTTQTKSAQVVSKGRFTSVLDFGANAFNGQARWLEIAVRCPSGSGVFTTLSPRQPLTAAPYALSLQPGAAVTGNTSASILNLTNNGSGNGVTVNSAGLVGVSVGSAPTGVQVDSAGVGVWVDSTTGGGIFVRSAGTVGLQVQSALNGVQVDNATGIGVAVGSAANGVVVNAATSWAGFFNGPVFAKTCTGCALAVFGINTGAAALAPGDIVAIQGTRSGGTTGQPMLMEVDQVTQANAPVVGVVYGRGELVSSVGPDGKTTTQLVPREGAAKPGDYVHIVIYGPAQVKASALGKTIAVGDKLAVDSSGAARGLKTVEVSGVQLAESAPTIGMALESLGASKNGLIWVLVNPK
jgi:hypothetical protein